MKKTTKIITAVVSAAAIASAIIATVAITSASEVSEQQKIIALHKELGAPDELKAGRYYYNGDKDTGLYIEVSPGGYIEYVTEDYEKTTQYVAEYVTPELTGLSGEEYKDTLKSNVDEMFSDGKTTYAIRCVNFGEYEIIALFGAEPLSNYEDGGSGRFVEYIDENTLSGSFNFTFIYVE